MPNFAEVPKFLSVDDAIEAQIAKDKFLPRDLYPRDGSLALHKAETRIGDLVGSSNVILYNSGMAAIRDAIEARLPAGATKLLRGRQVYNQVGSYIDNDLVGRGVRVLSTDSGSIEDLDKRFNSFVPDIAIFETVSNGIEMAVLDVERLIQLPIIRQTNPYIIFDNTLPSPVAFNMAELLKRYPERHMAVVESGTKFYSQNKDLSGIVYTENEDVLDALRKLRRKGGSTPGTATIDLINNVLPSAEEFENRNRTIFRNAYCLAYASDLGVRGNNRIFVSYPNLSSHESEEFSNLKAPEGIAPLFYMNVADLSQVEIVRKLWASPTVRKYCDLGQSFGFDRTRIWFDHNRPFIRISAGIENFEQIKELSSEFAGILRSFS